MKKRYLFVVCCFFYFSLCFAESVKDDINQQLAHFKKSDDLTEWINLRINYALENPSKNLPFLLNTKPWRSPKNNSEKEAWLYLFVYQGYYSLYNGDILTSIDKYEKALAYFNVEKLDFDAESYILKPLANNYTRIGDYGKAIYIQQKSLAISLNSKNDSLASSILNNLAISYLFKKEFTKAEKASFEGLQKASKNRTITGLLYAGLADIYFQQQKYPKAYRYIQIAISSLKKDQNYGLLRAFTLAGNICLKQNSLDKASDFYDKALQISATEFKESRKRELANILVQKSKIALKNHQLKLAELYLNKAQNALVPIAANSPFPAEKELYAEYILQDIFIEKANLYQLQNKEELVLKSKLLAFTVAEKLRKEYTYEQSKEQLQAEAKLQAESIIETAYDLFKETKNPYYAQKILEISEQTKARLLADEIKGKELKLAAKNPLYAEKIKLERLLSYVEKQKRQEDSALKETKIGDLKYQLSKIDKQLKIKNKDVVFSSEKLFQQIPKKSAALVFFYGDKNIYRLLVSREGVKAIEKIPDALVVQKNIQNFLNTYFYHGAVAMLNKPLDFYHHSFTIYQTLFDTKALNAYKNVILVRDGILDFLSFESLVTEKEYHQKLSEWPYLIKQKNIAYRFSLSNLAKATPLNQIKTQKFSGFFLSNTANNSQEIPAVKQEFNFLSEALKGNFFFNKDATTANFKTEFSGSDVLHISSHAYISTKDKEPVLELYKDKFYLFELTAALQIPHLVVLSACQTADGALLNGEGVMSMSRGFIAAGAKGVISGLWKVNDVAGAKLMQAFYRHLFEDKDVELSLRKAKTDWINDKSKDKTLLLPYYWDGLIYTGNPQFVQLEEKNKINKTLIISFLFVLSLVIIWVYFKRKKL